MRVRLAWLGMGTAAVLAAGCSSNQPGVAPLGSVLDAGTGAKNDAAMPVDASAGDEGDSSGGGSDVDAGSPFCAGHTWTDVPATSWVTGVQRFGGITPDELSIAWTSDGDTISVATRMLLTDPFGTPYTTVPIDPTTIANDRVALAMSGLMVVAVVADRSGFVAYTKEGSTWGPAPTDAFGNLRAMAMDTQAQFFEPVLGADGNFYYLFAPSGTIAGPPAMYQSTWNGQQRAWNTGVVFTNAELASSSATMRRRPTGVAEDGRTLFFFDEVSGTERMAARLSPSDPFTTFADVPSFPEAAPSGHCERLYFMTGGAIESDE
jgi:hypothetical protein